MMLPTKTTAFGKRTVLKLPPFLRALWATPNDPTRTHQTATYRDRSPRTGPRDFRFGNGVSLLASF